MTSNVSCWPWWWLRPQFRDEPQNLLEHLPWDGDLGHLEGDIAAVAHDLRAELDQLFLQTRQRPVLDRLRRRQRAQEIAETATPPAISTSLVSGPGSARPSGWDRGMVALHGRRAHPSPDQADGLGPAALRLRRHRRARISRSGKGCGPRLQTSALVRSTAIPRPGRSAGRSRDNPSRSWPRDADG